MANSDSPTAMLLPSLFELFCSYNCDGTTAMVQLRWFYGGERTFLFIQLRCFYRVYLSGSAMVQLRRFLLREIGLSVHAMVRWSNCDGFC
uniref:Uncharacterized protein n=1 Tax=Picea glauca TaxID=3330 RepID=A0A117NGC9_PICGL|nr:hypothetical protein ABT39_MTgene1713 [Picea glauca]